MLRSILSQLEYQHQVRLWDEKGVPFRTYMYVPEVHPITKRKFHEREDFAHVLKVTYCIHVLVGWLYVGTLQLEHNQDLIQHY